MAVSMAEYGSDLLVVEFYSRATDGVEALFDIKYS